MSTNSTREEVLVNATMQEDNDSVPLGCVNTKAPVDTAHDRGPPDPFLHLVDCSEVGRGSPKAPKEQGKAFVAPRNAQLVYDRPRTCPDDEGALSRPGRPVSAYQSTGASTALPEAGGGSSSDAVPVSRGIYWDTHSTRSLASVPEEQQATPPYHASTMGHI